MYKLVRGTIMLQGRERGGGVIGELVVPHMYDGRFLLHAASYYHDYLYVHPYKSTRSDISGT